MDDGKVKCGTHGWQDETFVCQHVAQSLRTGVPVGFHCADEESSSRPDAWCSACEEVRIAAGGEWTDQIYELLHIQLLCGACYDHARDIAERGHKLVQ